MSPQNGKTIELPEYISVRDLATAIQITPITVIKKLMSNGMMVTINQQVDYDTAAILVAEFGFQPVSTVVLKEALEASNANANAPAWRRTIDREKVSDLTVRPPVVTILGHVDHGKTSLLDVIRSASVAAGEAGGITQHIGAYQVVHNQRKITFLDTPGHAAFTAMRARGAQVTDIAILVVAADDGVMPQTREAAAHALAAGVPVIVALNKIDKPNANPERVMRQLSDINLTPDEWGGKTIVVPVSALRRKGIEDLLEAVLLVADETRIIANTDAVASGTVIEAERNKSKGVLVTLLVQNGTLREGDALVIGTVSGRIRAMFNDKGKKIKRAEPSTPVSVMGLSDVPEAGMFFEFVESEREAKIIAEKRALAQKQERDKPKQAVNLETLFSQMQAGKSKELNIIVKCDVNGSLEPIVSSLKKLETGELKVNVLLADTGNIGESDILLATASNAVVVGFNVTAESGAQRLADAQGISIRFYDIIYRLLEDIEKALKGLLDPVYKDVVLGKAEVRATFKIPKLGVIAGCYVLEGEMRRNAKVRVFRRTKQVFQGDMSSLKHEKDDVKEMRRGFECGIGLNGFSEFEQGDILECYTVEKVVG
jgi:translation initiation factor IF-2